jgi:hypothetical protein
LLPIFPAICLVLLRLVVVDCTLPPGETVNWKNDSWKARFRAIAKQVAHAFRSLEARKQGLDPISNS